MVGDKAEIAVASPPSSELSGRVGRTVYSGPLPADWDTANAVRVMRQKRLTRPLHHRSEPGGLPQGVMLTRWREKFLVP